MERKTLQSTGKIATVVGPQRHSGLTRSKSLLSLSSLGGRKSPSLHVLPSPPASPAPKVLAKSPPRAAAANASLAKRTPAPKSPNRVKKCVLPRRQRTSPPASSAALAQGPSFRDFVRDCRPFLVFNACQAVSIFLSGVCGWVLSMHALTASRSIGVYSATAIALMLPEMVLSPVTGWIADHWNKKRTIAFSDVGALCCSLAIGVIARTTGVRVRHIISANFVNGVCNAVQAPTSEACLPLLVPMRHRERAVVVRDAIRSAVDIVMPLAGGVVAGRGVSLGNLMWLDFAGYIFGATALLLIAFPAETAPKPGPSASILPLKKSVGDRSLAATLATGIRQLSFGVRYICGHRGVLKVVTLYSVSRFCIGTIGQVLPAYMLSYGSVTTVGSAMTLCCLGFAFGSVLITVFGLSRRPIRLALAAMFVQGIILFSPVRRLWHVVFGGMVFLALQPAIVSACNLVYMTCIEPGILGRVTATAQAASAFASCLAMVAVGPLVEHVAEPLLDTVLQNTVITRFLCTGNDRGIALVWIIVGLIQCTFSALLFGSSSLQRLEKVAVGHLTKGD